MTLNSATDVVLKTQALQKVFKVGFWGRQVTALEGLDLEVRRGEVFGFWDPMAPARRPH